MEIFWAEKLVGKGGESSESGGEYVVLPTQMQGPVPTQRQGRSLVPTLWEVGIGPPRPNSEHMRSSSNKVFHSFSAKVLSVLGSCNSLIFAQQ